jgi:hypothetical protein
MRRSRHGNRVSPCIFGIELNAAASRSLTSLPVLVVGGQEEMPTIALGAIRRKEDKPSCSRRMYVLFV